MNRFRITICAIDQAKVIMQHFNCFIARFILKSIKIFCFSFAKDNHNKKKTVNKLTFNCFTVFSHPSPFYPAHISASLSQTHFIYNKLETKEKGSDNDAGLNFYAFLCLNNECFHKKAQHDANRDCSNSLRDVCQLKWFYMKEGNKFILKDLSEGLYAVRCSAGRD